MKQGQRCTIVLCLLVLSLLSPLVPSTVQADDAIRYANYTTGDSFGNSLYADNWSAQTFNWSTSFIATYARVKIARDGTGGTLTVAIRATNATGYPTGDDLCSGTLSTTSVTTSLSGDWYTIDFDDYTLSANTQYALVARYTGESTSNDLYWRDDSASGAYATGMGYESSDGGATFTPLASSDDDFMFEIWGTEALDIYTAAVFQDYYASGDWLITCSYLNTYVPYYPIDNPKTRFSFQLLSGSTVIAQTPLPQWGYKPVGLYLSAATVTPLTWGSAYTLRIYGIDSPYPSYSYTLTAADWKGSDLTLLDDWCRATARGMEAYYDETFIVSTSEKGDVLNEEGGVMFTNGIPGIMAERPGIFQAATSSVPYTDPTWTGTYSGGFDEWYTQLGPDISSIVNSTADLVDTDGESLLQILLIVVYGIVAVLMVAHGMNAGAFAVASPFLMFGYMIKVLPWAALGVGIAILVMMAVRQLWWKST